MSDVVSRSEDLSDEALVALIMIRSDLDDEAAREALAIIRGDSAGDFIEV